MRTITLLASCVVITFLATYFLLSWARSSLPPSSEKRLLQHLGICAIVALSFLLLPPAIPLLQLLFVLVYPPTRWIPRYYLWRAWRNIANCSRSQQLLVCFGFAEKDPQTRELPTRAYCHKFDLILSRLAARVFEALSDPGSTLNDIAQQTCRTIAEGSQPPLDPPTHQMIANYFQLTPPSIYIKPFLVFAAPGYVSKDDRRNEMAINELFVDELLSTLSYWRYTQMELYLLVTIYHEAIHCLTKHLWDSSLSPPLCKQLWSGIGAEDESRFFTEALLAGGRVFLQVWPSPAEPEVTINWEKMHSTVFQPGTTDKCSNDYRRFGIMQLWKYRRCFGQRTFHTPIFGTGQDCPLERIPAEESSKFQRLRLTPPPHPSSQTINLLANNLRGLEVHSPKLLKVTTCAIRQNIN